MKSVYYTKIVPRGDGQTVADVISHALTMGITLVEFGGYSNDECRNRKAQVRANMDAIQEVVTALTINYDDNTYDCPVIQQVREPAGRNYLEDDEAESLLRAWTGQDADI